MLNNIDKHRRINVAVFNTASAEADLRGLPPGITKLSINDNPLQQHDWLIRIETAASCAGPEGKMKFSIRLSFAEETLSKKPLLEILKASIDSVVQIVNSVK